MDLKFNGFPMELFLLKFICYMQTITTLTHYRLAMQFGNRKKNILKDLFILVLSQFKN